MTATGFASQMLLKTGASVSLFWNTSKKSKGHKQLDEFIALKRKGKKKLKALKFPITTEVNALDFFIFVPVFSWQVKEFNKKGTNGSKTNRV